MLRTRLQFSSSYFFSHALRLVFLTVVLLLCAQRSSLAQAQPTVLVDPSQGPAGIVFAVDVFGFTPGNYTGSVFWDGELVATFPIDSGGTGGTQLVAPSFATPGTHEVRVCAGNPCFTGQNAQSAARTVEITGPMPVTTAQIAYLFTKDATGVGEDVARQFQALLQTYGMTVRLVTMEEIATTDFAVFDLVIVASNTGQGALWGTPDQAAQINKAPRVLALGEGGYALLGKIAPALGYPNGETKDHPGTVTLPNFNLSIAKTPHSFVAFSQRAIPVFGGGTAINIPKPPTAAIPLAYTAVFGDPSTESVILTAGCRTFWGFSIPPSRMSAAGRALFANTVFYALGAGCSVNADTSCSQITDPGTIPSSVTLNFDEWQTGTILGDLYVDSVGVRFENNQSTQALVYTDNPNDVGKSFSSPNVATNSAIFPNTSQGVPMQIQVPPGRTHVGFRLGNGKDNTGAGPDIPALISAYDAAGVLLCRYQVTPVPTSHIVFSGIYDDQGRIASVVVDYGSSSLSESIDDFTFGPAQYATDIRICRTVNGVCQPVDNATVHVLRNGTPTGDVLRSDVNGYLLDREKVQFGDSLWAMTPVTATETYTRYLASPSPTLVTLSAFNRATGMTVNIDTPLILHDLTIAAQWDMTADAAYRAALAQRILDASNHFYDFTDGQMALGTVTVYQNYDQWNDADVRLYASNVMRPQAEIGGIVTALTTDLLLPAVQYNPGFVYMGSNWNRSGEPVAGIGIDPDWSVAFAHELGHYLLFLFDTYLSLNDNNEAIEIDTCTGSAMGFAYLDGNTEYIFDPVHWNSVCGETLANQTLGRTEWATIKLWYADVIIPTAVNSGPVAMPAPLTRVDFVAPSSPTTPTPNQTFSLGYQNSETASEAARGWLIHDQRVQDQGSPISGTTTITLTNAQLGDRFCLFDINPEESRRQFGCEIIELGDNALTLRKDANWAPVVQVSPVTSYTINISVTQAVESGATVQATIYPEDQNNATSIDLVSSGITHTGTFVSPVPATSAYVSVNVAEDATEENPRREVMIGYGVGGSGAYGPAWRLGGAPIISSDGNAEYALGADTLLTDGQYLLWQSMAGSPGADLNVDVLGNAYRLLAQPASLADDGILSIRLPDTPPPTARSLNATAADPEIHFWTGSEWVPVGSRVVEDPQGGAKLIGRSRGVGVYALLVPPQNNVLYIPAIQR